MKLSKGQRVAYKLMGIEPICRNCANWKQDRALLYRGACNCQVMFAENSCDGFTPKQLPKEFKRHERSC